jgi:hypothetical protein
VTRPRGRQLTVIQQAVRLKTRFPNERQPEVKLGQLTWTVTLKPTPMSVHYTARVRYKHRQRPVVTVVSPELQTRQGEPLPHVYSGDELCLYYGSEFDGGEHFIADTIVPWTSEWLMYYEMWLTTGEWLASEVRHDAGSIKR